MGDRQDRMRYPGDACPPDCRYSMAFSSTGDGRCHRHCGFILRTGRIRGCDCGPGCIRYDNGRKPEQAGQEKSPFGLRWDVARGRRLWEQGESQGAIAREMGISRASVERRAKMYWKKGMD